MDATREPGASIVIEALTQRFGSSLVLDRIDLQVPAGQVLALLGRSGCGKTTLLKLLAGLLAPTSGRIAMNDQIVADGATFVAPEKRGLGMVFQDYALWPHMTVVGNVMFALTMRGVSRASARKQALAALDRVGLAALADRGPSSLSGGQQQRVALARAIVARPRILLFDEPLSNLDRDLRESLCIEIAALLREVGTTAVYVTHDHEEAFTLADRVAVMQGGRIAQLDTPEQLVHHPVSIEVAQFLKLGMVLSGKRTESGWQLADGLNLLMPSSDHDVAMGQGSLYVPHTALAPGAGSALSGRVLAQRYRAGHYETRLRTSGGAELTMLTSERLQNGSDIGIDIDWQRLRWFSQAA